VTAAAGPIAIGATLRSVPPAIWVLCAGAFVNRLAFVSVFLMLYITRLGFSPGQAGVAVSASGLGALAAPLVGGCLGDRIGRRATIAASMFGSAAVLLAMSQVRSLGLLIALSTVKGLTAESHRPAASALIADLVPQGSRVPAFALYRLALNLGFAAGAALAGFLADHSFTILFVADAATSASFGLISLAALPRTTRHSAGRPAGRARRGVLGDRTMMVYIVAAALAALIYFQSVSTLALQVRAAGLSVTIYGAMLSVNGLLVACLEFPLAHFTQRRPPRQIILSGWLIQGAGFALTPFARSAPPLIGTVVVWTTGEILAAPVSAAYVADLAPPGRQARYQGAAALPWSIAQLLAGGVGGAVFMWSHTGLWAGCLGINCLAASLLRWLTPRKGAGLTPGAGVGRNPGPAASYPEICHHRTRN
jgi:MFS family permease